MSGDEAREAVVSHLMGKSDMALLAAKREYAAGDLGLAMNRVYYACFYAASAVLLNEKREFVKHAGLRSAVHQHLVKAGKLSPKLGKFFDDAFEDRQQADYEAMVEFEPGTVEAGIEGAEQFVEQMRRLLGTA